MLTGVHTTGLSRDEARQNCGVHWLTLLKKTTVFVTEICVIRFNLAF